MADSASSLRRFQSLGPGVLPRTDLPGNLAGAIGDPNPQQQEPKMEADQSGEVPAVVIHHLRGTDADAVDAVIYCVNQTPYTFHVATRSESFTTADEETGAVARHGPPPKELTVRAGETARLGDVYGWEWDGIVSLVVWFLREGSPKWLSALYTFNGHARWLGDMVIPGPGVEGVIARPSWLSAPPS
jgi:hypothetical protein